MPSFARSGPTFCCFSIWFFMGDQFLQSHGSSRSKYSVTTLDSCSSSSRLEYKMHRQRSKPKTINASTPQWLKISLWVALFNLLRVSGYAWKPRLTWKSILVFARTGWGHFSNLNISKVAWQIDKLLSSHENLVFWASSGFGLMSKSRFLLE